jgi:FKBP-type peptidyl-prolyl cis-trans isomerase
MALFNHLFPYTNLHDINLDWIISIIKSIDPAVIQALQQLTPDIIEQVTQKVNEAQAAAIAAQSSASEANTAKENAATSAAEAEKDATEAAAAAALANADAVRAENAANNAANVVADALAVKSSGIAPTAHASVGDVQILRSGKTITFYLTGTLTGKATGTRSDVGTVSNLPTLTSARRFCAWFWRGGVPSSVGMAEISTDGILSVNNANFEIGDMFFIDTAFMI